MRLRMCLAFLLLLFGPPVMAQDTDESDDHEISIPDTMAGRELRWVFDAINKGAPDDIAARMTPRFLGLHPAAEIAAAFKDLHENAFGGERVYLIGADQSERDDYLSGFVKGGRRVLSVFIVVNDTTHKIDDVHFAAAGYRITGVGDWDAYRGEMGRLNGSAAFGVYEIVTDEVGRMSLVSIQEFHANRMLNVASTGKLFVLGALAGEVAAGRAKWDEAVTIREALKSVPESPTKAAEAGSTMTVAALAESMMGVNDASAADHLLDRVSREKAGEYYRATGGAAKFLPFLSTLDCYHLKLCPDQELTDQYVLFEADERQRMLAPDGPIGKTRVTPEMLKAWRDPSSMDTIGWMASTDQIAHVYLDLRKAEQKPGMEPLAGAMRKKSGGAFEGKTWPRVAYKGGTEPGVLNMSWLLERDDHRWFVFALTWNNPKDPIEEDRIGALVQKAGELMDMYERPKDGEKGK